MRNTTKFKEIKKYVKIEEYNKRVFINHHYDYSFWNDMMNMRVMNKED